MNIFDFYWDYNEKHDLIIIGFMYAGYYVAINTEGEIVYVVESIQHPGRLPKLINTDSMLFVDDEGKTIMNWLSTNIDEAHIVTASAMDSKKEKYGALIDVIDTKTGEYKFSYVLDEVFHWPILLLDDYSLVSVTENYELITWKRGE